MTARTEPAKSTASAGTTDWLAAGAALSAADGDLVGAVDEQLVRQLAGRAVAGGLSLTGEGVCCSA